MYLTLTLLSTDPEVYRGGAWVRVLDFQRAISVLDDDVHRVVIGDKPIEREIVLSQAHAMPSISRNRVQLVLGRHQHARARNHAERLNVHVANHSARPVRALMGDDALESVIPPGSSATLDAAGFVELLELPSAESALSADQDEKELIT